MRNVQAPQWISYCNLELAHNVFDRVEAIFGRCCRTSTSVDLWRFYLDYIRRVNPIDPANLELAKQARSIIGAAFDFALSHVGHDRRAGEIWVEYLTFLREAPVRCFLKSFLGTRPSDHCYRPGAPGKISKRWMRCARLSSALCRLPSTTSKQSGRSITRSRIT